MDRTIPPRDPAFAWHERISSAASVEEVVRVARDFVAGMSSEELAGFPEGCRPEALSEPSQVTFYALRLAREHDGNARAAPAMHRTSIFFTKAGLRIFELKTRHSGSRAAA